MTGSGEAARIEAFAGSLDTDTAIQGHMILWMLAGNNGTRYSRPDSRPTVGIGGQPESDPARRLTDY